MPIQSADIKLLKSAVMADTPDGGGPMTGTVVVDGQSNNLFPDTSAMDRAFGRVQMRKVFGVAHSDDTATAMGAHAILTQAPADPLVHCALLKTAGWADTRTTARDVVERYLVKGPRLAPRLYDVHYAGSLQIKLVSFVGGAGFPKSGDCIVLANPAAQGGAEQYVRLTKVTQATEQVAVVENNSVVVLTASVATCDLAQTLAHDFFGPAPARTVTEANYCQLYTTSSASGARFYGIKPLAAAAAPGDYSVTVEGGIYTPLVPAATIESPVIDTFPLLGRGAVCATASAAVTLPAVSAALGPGTVLTLPTAIEPQSLAFTHGTTSFTTDNAGNLLQGATVVGAVEHAAGRVVMASTAPSYGTATLTLSYKPASSTSASAHSAAFTITSQNQGLAYTNVFEPPPGPGSFVLSYMAQGRWYDLADNLQGKLAGGDSGYGVGNINYSTGSMGVTLGAIPDVDSALIATWGDGNAAKALGGTLPARLGTLLTLPLNAQASGITVTWSRAGTNYTASTNASGQLSGDATGYVQYNGLRFEPAVFPDGDVTVTASTGPSQSTQVTANGGGSYTLTGGSPILPGSFRGTVLTTFDPSAYTSASALAVWDELGILKTSFSGSSYAIGTIDYNTGDVTLSASVNMQMAYRDSVTRVGGWAPGTVYGGINYGPKPVVIGALSVTRYTYGSGEAQPAQAQTPGAWTMQLPVNGAQLATTGLCFKVGADVYTASVGTLRRGWSVHTGAPGVAAAGTVDSAGTVTVSALPTNWTNAVTWYNVAVNLAGAAVSAGVFRTDNAPLKAGVFQLQSGADVAQGNAGGNLSGGNFSGSVEYARGIVSWSRISGTINPADLSYNAVFLQYLPLEASLLGIETARLPLDGKVPIYRAGDLNVIHNTQTLTLPNPVTRDAAQSLGRERLAGVRVLDANGTLVPDTLYTADLDPGTLTVPAASDLTGYTQPLTVEHRVEDMLLCSVADISGQLKFTRSLTHDYAAGASYVSSALPFGDLFARAHTYIEQATWTSAWSDTRIGSVITANFNEGAYPIAVTNKGAISERWALIFTGTTSFNVVGENVGVIGTGTTAADCAPLNPATGAPYFTLPALGWGAGWSTGNVLRFNTDACGAPFWPVRTVLQGPATLQSDQFQIAFRLDVDRP